MGLGETILDLWQRQPGAVIQSVGIIVQFIAFVVTGIVVYYTLVDRPLQRRRIYLDLEFEASRIFRICIDHPEVISYLESKAQASDKSSEEKSYWFVCQCLNAFEIMISFRAQRMVSKDLFATWVSWFHELGTYERFAEFWYGRNLWSHYKDDLQEVMNLAIRLRRARRADFDEKGLEQELERFHREVSAIFDDRSIQEFWVQSAKRNARA
jgi:hypothetical protein